MASTPPPPPPPIAHLRAPPLLTLIDELLEEIFLRLPTLTDLARASTVCPSFRRVITHRCFLRRFRAVHPPPLLGFLPRGQYGFYPARRPYPSAPLARAVAHAADFSYSFVPVGRWLKPWLPCDHRQGRVLLKCLPRFDQRYDFRTVVFLSDLDLAVCDPLHRRYVLLPSVPHQMTDQHACLVDFDAFLAPTDENVEETTFKVICTAWNQTNLFAFVFSSVTGQWCIAASPSWSSLGTEAPISDRHKLANPDYACGCFYWTGHWVVKLIVLDATEMEFSIVDSVLSSPLIKDSRKFGIVEGAEGTPLVFFFGAHRDDDSLDLLHITKLNGSEPSEQQQWENIISLASGRYSIYGAAEGFLFLHGIPKDQPIIRHNRRFLPEREYFSLDMKTSELKKVGQMKHILFSAHALFGFPRSFNLMGRGCRWAVRFQV
ncbi:hypothetical protein U9M48_015567 [Paspalum notatum var. saurae]|uniref:F-box domain-containing protein n=1 Tax=Paspalum notatum var. saurae TaxID=547442 RepID=A0AAQ3WLZ2_PASNO